MTPTQLLDQATPPPVIDPPTLDLEVVEAPGPETIAPRGAATHQRPSTVRRAVAAVAPPLVAIALVLLTWEGYVRWKGEDQYILVAPTAIVQTLFGDLSFYVSHGQTTALEALLGLALGGVLAFVSAALMSQFRTLERALLPIAVLVKVTPMVAIAPLFIIWMGFGLAPKVLIAGLITFFPILVNCITGFKALDPHVHEVMRAVHASRTEVFFRLRLPQCLPHLFSALKICVTLSLIGALVAELQGSSRGLGNVIVQAAMYLDMERMFASIAALAVMGLTLTSLVTFLEHRALRWLGLGHVEDH
jgi:NitT/TauT family transport system permease protein